MCRTARWGKGDDVAADRNGIGRVGSSHSTRTAVYRSDRIRGRICCAVLLNVVHVAKAYIRFARLSVDGYKMVVGGVDERGCVPAFMMPAGMALFL